MTPNEKNWIKLAERFLYDDRIVYDDGTRQFTLEMLQEEPIMIDRQIGYHSARYLCGNEAILYLLKSPTNRIRNEITDVINDLEMKVYEENRLLTPQEVEEMENEFPFENENEPLYTIEIDYGDEPLTMRQIDENGNETVRKIQKTIGNGLETRIIFVDENENENENQFENELKNGNENGNELGNENTTRNELQFRNELQKYPKNETKKEQENGLLDTLQNSYTQLKKNASCYDAIKPKITKINLPNTKNIHLEQHFDNTLTLQVYNNKYHIQPAIIENKVDLLYHQYELLQKVISQDIHEYGNTKQKEQYLHNIYQILKEFPAEYHYKNIEQKGYAIIKQTSPNLLEKGIAYIRRTLQRKQ